MIDFGTARDLGKNQKDRHAAKTKVYTEGYAPLEQIAGKPEPRSDLLPLRVLFTNWQRVRFPKVPLQFMKSILC